MRSSSRKSISKLDRNRYTNVNVFYYKIIKQLNERKNSVSSEEISNLRTIINNNNVKISKLKGEIDSMKMLSESITEELDARQISLNEKETNVNNLVESLKEKEDRLNEKINSKQYLLSVIFRKLQNEIINQKAKNEEESKIKYTIYIIK